MRSPAVPPPGDPPRRRGRLLRWGLRILAALAGLGVVVILAALVVLHSLDRPWLKRRVQALARTSAGVDIDYRTVRIGALSGAEIEGLVVQSPAEVRALAPELLRIGHLEARWQLRALFGGGAVLQQLTISQVTVTVVVDERGVTSFDALSAAPAGQTAPPSTTTPPVPLSRRAASLLRARPPVGRVDVDDVTFNLVRTDHGEISERTELHGLSVALATMAASPPGQGWRMKAALGSPEAPLDLKLAREHGGTSAAARARLWLTADASSSALSAALDLRMTEQTFAPSVSADHWLHAEAMLRFDGAAGRTEVTLDHIEAGDGAASAEASIEVPDKGDPIVRHAHGDVDLARLLRWLPAGLAPVTAERARVRYRVESFVAGPVLRLSEGGSVAVDADLSNVEVSVGDGPIHIGGGKLSFHAEPAPGGGVAGRGSFALAGTRLASGGTRLAVDDLRLDFDGRQETDGAVSGHAGVRFARVAIEGASPVLARGGHIDLHAEGLYPGAEDPLTTRGDLTLSTDLASLETRVGPTRAIADGLALRAHTLLAGHPPYAVELEVPVSRLRVLGRGDNLLADAPARVEARLRETFLDLVHPAASRGIGHVAVSLGESKASLDATKGGDSVDFTLGAAVPSLRVARPFLTHALATEAPWDQIGVVVKSSGRIDRMSGDAPTIEQTTDLDVERPAFDRVAARSLSLTLRSKGTALRHEANADIHVRALAFGGGAPSDDHATLAATLDREGRSLRLQLGTDGLATTKVSAAVSFDASRRALPYDIDVHLAGLAPLAPFLAKVPGLAGFDLSQLDLGLSARGALLGVVAGVGRDGSIQLEPHPSRSVGLEGKMDARVAHFQWTQGDNAVLTPAAAWHGEFHVAGARRTVDSHLVVDALHLDLGPKDVDIAGIRDDTTATVTGDLADPETELTQHTAIRSVQQNLVPEYPLGDLTLALSAERGREGVVHISDMKVANALGGTALAVTGNLDLGEGHQTLSVTTSLTQDLARLSTTPDRFKGRGKVAVEANVTSPDLAHYHVRAAVKGADVNFTLPRDGVEMEAANGEVPITVSLEVGEHGVALERTEKQSPYSMLRFADQHPLLSRSGFLSIARLKTPFVSIAPLVGNLEIEQNVVSLRQFEMGVRGGSITGQCGIDWDGPKSTLELHVRASGVQSSHGEPFDGNIAVVISAADRTVEGRAEILRIGERHLLDLLDLQDPLHVDPAMNRIRTALVFGYPDSLRLVFDHGFASAHLELGGLARLVSIGELRGIPMGPIVDKLLAPILDGLDTKETQ